LNDGTNYNALVFNDETHDTMRRSMQKVNKSGELAFAMMERGGFAVCLTADDNQLAGK
jgi:hypothetical protein